MTIPVILSISSQQRYEGQEPDRIDLVTEGTLEELDSGAWRISYAESELTGLQGVTTSFELEKDRITLRRTGALHSEMIFEENVCHESLYEMEFGALMIGICAKKIHTELSAAGGSMDVTYAIQVEQNQAGTVVYHIDVKPT